MKELSLKKKLKEQANKLPLLPGVYIMKNASDEVIYVGKAKSIKNRVTQYFGSETNHSSKVRKMVENVEKFETILCDSEYEALILENSLIKQYQPKYNILLKDDKGYHYIKVTNELWPKIKAVKNMIDDGAEYIGPYYSASTTNQTVDEILKIYKIPSCNRDFNKKSKPCLNYHIGTCFAPCINQTTNNEYENLINSAVKHIKNGGIDDVEIDRLKAEMLEASERLNFEYAARLRDRIQAIEKSKQKQKVIFTSNKREDVIASVIADEKACVSILIFNNGHLTDKKLFYLDGVNNKKDIYGEFLLQYYESAESIPPYIAIDTEFEDIEIIKQWLSELKGSVVNIHVPVRSTQKQLIDMCTTNAAQALANRIERNVKETAALSELAELLGLDKTPNRIESYDISNTAGSENVAAMIVFINGRYDKTLTRKFKIKSFTGQDDFRSLAETIERRFNEYFVGTDYSYKQLPDLILLDGGKGQLSAVKSVLEKLNLDIPIFGMVKDSKHKTRAITAGDDDIQINANRKAFTLVNNIQNEVHRVAISYHHQRNKLSTLKTELTEIKGIGEVTAQKLLKTFKSVKKVKEATMQDFIDNGFSERIANIIIDYYKK